MSEGVGRLPGHIVSSLSESLVRLSRFVPREFARKPRSLAEVERWKAVEFRNFLLYTGPVVLSECLSAAVFNHFLILSVAIRLLLSPELNSVYNEYAEQLLVTFVEMAKQLYGAQFIVYHVHNLVHLAADAKRFGSLDRFSCFPFENQLRFIKKLVRTSNLPLPQIVRRLSEQRSCETTAIRLEAPELSAQHEHSMCPVPFDVQYCKQYK